MPLGTTYTPTRASDFESSKLSFNAQGVFVLATAGDITNLDYTPTDDCLVTGCWLIVNDAAYGDTASFQVVDTSGAFTGTPGTVLNQFITNWYMAPKVDTQIDMIYPAKIFGGMTLRLVYKSVGTVSPFVATNYKLHKVLI